MCHAARPEEPQSMQQSHLHSQIPSQHRAGGHRAHASPAPFSWRASTAASPPQPWGDPSIPHHATLGKKRPHTVRITFFPPPLSQASHRRWARPGLPLTPLTGALGSHSSGFLAEAAESGPQPCSKGLTLPAVALLQLQAAKPRPGPPRALLPLPVPLCSHLPSLH